MRGKFALGDEHFIARLKIHSRRHGVHSRRSARGECDVHRIRANDLAEFLPHPIRPGEVGIHWELVRPLLPLERHAPRCGSRQRKRPLRRSIQIRHTLKISKLFPVIHLTRSQNF